MVSKKIYTIIFPNSIEKTQENFLEHYKNFKPVLDEITQSKVQQDSTFALVSTSVFQSKLIQTKEFLNLVTFPTPPGHQDNFSLAPNVSTSAATAFLEQSRLTSNKIIFKDPVNLQNNFKVEATHFISNTERGTALKLEAESLSNILINQNPYYFQAVTRFTSSLDVTSSCEHIGTLIQFAKFQELLTGLSLSQQLSLGMGFKLYALTFYSLQNKNSLKIFLAEVKTRLLNSNMSNLRGEISNIIYENRYSIFTTTLFATTKFCA